VQGWGQQPATSPVHMAVPSPSSSRSSLLDGICLPRPYRGLPQAQIPQPSQGTPGVPPGPQWGVDMAAAPGISVPAKVDLQAGLFFTLQLLP
jgi:hypothetical protein